jgi:large subunit ribosomal protein L17
MRKQVFGRKFKRDKNERKALFKGLISSMILKGRISTTLEKAKSVQGDVEKLVTKAKKGEAARLELKKSLTAFEVDKLINQIGPVFKDRPGGYTRIIKTGKRFNDNASTAIMEWVEVIPEVEKSAPAKSSKKTTAKTAKKEVKQEKPAKRSLSLRRSKKETKYCKQLKHQKLKESGI